MQYDIKNTHVHYNRYSEYQKDSNTPGKLDPNAIVFVGDTGKIYTHGETYGGDSTLTQFNLYKETTDSALGNILTRILNIEATMNNYVTISGDQVIVGNKEVRNKGIIKEGDTWIAANHTKADYVWLADGTVKLIEDICKANPQNEDEPTQSTHTVTIMSGQYGAFKVLSDSDTAYTYRQYEVLDGSNIIITLIPNANCEVKGLYINNGPFISYTASEYTLPNVKAGYTILIAFDRILQQSDGIVRYGYGSANSVDWDNLLEETNVSSIGTGTVTWLVDDIYGSNGAQYWYYIASNSIPDRDNILRSGVVKIDNVLTGTTVPMIKVSTPSFEGYTVYRSKYPISSGEHQYFINPNAPVSTNRTITINAQNAEWYVKGQDDTGVYGTKDSYTIPNATSIELYVKGVNGYEIQDVNGQQPNSNGAVTLTIEDGMVIEIHTVESSNPDTPTPTIKTVTVSNTNEHVRYYVRDYDASTYENPYAYHTSSKTYTIAASDDNIRIYVMCDDGYTVTAIGGEAVSVINGYNVASVPVTDGKVITFTVTGGSTTPDNPDTPTGDTNTLTILATGKHLEYWVSSYDIDPNEGGVWKDTDDTYTILSGQSQVIIYVRGKSGYNVTKANGRNVTNGQVTIPASEGTVTFTVEQIPTTNYPKLWILSALSTFRVYGTGVSTINSTEPITVDSATWIENTQSTTESTEIYRIIPGGDITIDFAVSNEYQLDCIFISQEGVARYTIVYPNELTTFTESGKQYYRYTRTNESSTSKIITFYEISEVNGKTRPVSIDNADIKPVYYGFAGSTINSTDDIPQYAYGAAEDENTEYTSTATSTNKYWWLAVPKTWGTPVVKYKQGGMGVDMEKQDSMGDNIYDVYRSRSFRVTGASTDYTFVIN